MPHVYTVTVWGNKFERSEGNISVRLRPIVYLILFIQLQRVLEAVGD